MFNTWLIKRVSGLIITGAITFNNFDDIYYHHIHQRLAILKHNGGRVCQSILCLRLKVTCIVGLVVVHRASEGQPESRNKLL